MIVSNYPITPWNEFPHPGVHEAPREYVDERNEFRLTRRFREAAQSKDPRVIFAFAVERLIFSIPGGPGESLGFALADLAVTGREAYAAFRTLDLSDPDGPHMTAIKDIVRMRLGDAMPGEVELNAAVAKVVDRAYAVAWALRGPVAERAARRAAFRWLAVSGEDDVPHRPVNMPGPPYEQYEIDVTARGMLAPITIRTRFVVAAAQPSAPAPIAYAPRTIPPDPDPAHSIPADHRILLFLHGHSSGAEEALDIIPHLLTEGRRRKKNYAVISFDLPNNGYSQTFDHRLVALSSASTFPKLPLDTGPVRTPVLDFVEDFVVAFVNQLNMLRTAAGYPSINDQFEAVIGGSLGGNLGLRLGRRDVMPDWLNRNIVAWSPASVWYPMVQHQTRHEGPEHCFVEFQKPDTEFSRREYFRQVYENQPLPGVLKQQSAYWYRRGFASGDARVELSRVARWEIYNAFYRQWHWRLAGEQLIYSHFDNEEHGDNTTAVRYTKNFVRTLLVAGEDDNYSFSGIYDGTKTLGAAMTATPGRLLLIADSGHSIHAERPRYFAFQIVKFLSERSLQIDCVRLDDDGRIESVGGYNHTAAQRFRMTQQECLVALELGDDIFVEVDGSRAEVVIGYNDAVSTPRYFIKTAADDGTSNNLLSLGECPPMPSS